MLCLLYIISITVAGDTDGNALIVVDPVTKSSSLKFMKYNRYYFTRMICREKFVKENKAVRET